MQNLQWNMQRNKNVSIRHRNILKFCLIPCLHRPQTTRLKHRWMTHIIQVQGQKQTKPVTSSNKPSTFPAKCKSDNEETPLKQPH